MGDLKAQVSNLGSLGILGSNTSMVFVIVEVFVYSEDVRNFGSKDIIGASNPGLYHDHENNQYQHETQIS